MNLLKKILLIIFALATVCLLTVVGLYFYYKNDLPPVSELKDVKLQTPMRVYSQDGLLINQFGEKRRIPVGIEQMPPHLVQAFIATEDSRFYQHPGVDAIGVLRSFVTLITTGQKKQGASTITMQVARNFFPEVLSRKKEYSRKVKEAFTALAIEQILSKDEILELYLNKIELGNRAFGVGAAAQVYYGKSLSELSLAQIATIAGLPKAPTTYNPIKNPEKARDRRAVVLGRMYEMEFITKEEYEQALLEPVTAKMHGAEIALSAPYVSEMVRAQMVDLLGEEEAYNGGYQVFVTMNAQLQRAAQQAVIENIHRYDERHGYRGALTQLWNAEQPIPNRLQIINSLKRFNGFGKLIAAAVVKVEEQTISVVTEQGDDVTLPWTAINWARKYLSDTRQGADLKSAGDIFTVGQQIVLRKTIDGAWRLAQLPEVGSALISLNPKTGAIEALVGGYSFEQSQYNRVTQAKRQIGSNIKPFIYSGALENGYTLASLINDAPINQWDKSTGVAWQPKNSPEIYEGLTRLRVALAKSKNVVSVRLVRGMGVEKTRQYLSKFGFTLGDIPKNESLSLGTASFTPLEVARGMATFANDGFLIEPYLVDKIIDGNGNVIFKANPKIACLECELQQEQQSSDELEGPQADITADESDKPDSTWLTEPQAPSESAADSSTSEPQPLAPRVISKQNAFLVSQAMTSAIWGGGDWNYKTGWNGTAWRAQRLKRHDLSGKTGTTNDSVDTWFSGFTADLVTTTWVGFDNPGRSLGRVRYDTNQGKEQYTGAESGANTALPAWIDYMAVALPLLSPEQSRLMPEGIVNVRIDAATGLRTERTDYSSEFEYFLSGTEPTQFVAPDTTPIFTSEGEQPTEEELF